MAEILEILKAYKEFGWVVICIIISYYFYRDLQSSRREYVDMTVKVTQSLDKSTMVLEESLDIHKDVVKAIDEAKHNNQNFIEFQKGRDEGRRHSNE